MIGGSVGNLQSAQLGIIPLKGLRHWAGYTPIATRHWLRLLGRKHPVHSTSRSVRMDREAFKDSEEAPGPQSWQVEVRPLWLKC